MPLGDAGVPRGLHVGRVCRGDGLRAECDGELRGVHAPDLPVGLHVGRVHRRRHLRAGRHREPRLYLRRHGVPHLLVFLHLELVERLRRPGLRHGLSRLCLRGHGDPHLHLRSVERLERLRSRHLPGSAHRDPHLHLRPRRDPDVLMWRVERLERLLARRVQPGSTRIVRGLWHDDVRGGLHVGGVLLRVGDLRLLLLRNQCLRRMRTGRGVHSSLPRV
jgi:hypothetical protein